MEAWGQMPVVRHLLMKLPFDKDLRDSWGFKDFLYRIYNFLLLHTRKSPASQIVSRPTHPSQVYCAPNTPY